MENGSSRPSVTLHKRIVRVLWRERGLKRTLCIERCLRKSIMVAGD